MPVGFHNAAKLEEVTAVFVRETWRSENGEGDFFFGVCRPASNGSASPLFSREFSIACNAEPGEVKPGMEYRWWGKREEDPKWGPKLKVATFTLAKPHSQAGVVKYLQECPHIGQATATAIWNKFRGDSVRILRENPEVVSAAVPRFPLDKATEAAAKLVELSSIEDTSIELIDLLHGRGFPKDLARQCVKRWGNKSAEFIRRDPYILQFARGVGFLKTDSMYLDLGLPPDKMKRQVYCAWYGIASDSEGHTYLPEKLAVDGIRAKVSGVTVNPDKAIAIAKRSKAVATRRDCTACRGTGIVVAPDLFFGEELVEQPCAKCDATGGKLWLADSRKAKAEEYVARHIVNAEHEADAQTVTEYEDEVEKITVVPTHTRCTRCRRKLTAPEVAILNDQPFGPDCITKVEGGEVAERMPLADWLALHPLIYEHHTSKEVGTSQIEFYNLWPDASELADVTEHQRDEIGKALIGRIGIFGGAPGAGKTWTAARLIKAIIKKHGIGNVAVCAPTGKAATRCRETLANYEVNVNATTIHSLLGVESVDEGGWKFRHGERNPLPYKFIIVDEFSMTDCSLLASFLAARGRGTHLLFIGDVNQLPPVGHGAPLRDLIAAGVPYGQLTEIHRNAGTIVRACAAIREQQAIPTDNEIELEPKCETCGGSGSVEKTPIIAAYSEHGDREQESCPNCNGGRDKLPPRNLKLIPASKDTAPRKLLDLIAEIRDAGEFDPIWGVQVCVAVNKRSTLSRESLNKQLQEILNPNGMSVKGSPFRVGDKVIQLKNGFLKVDKTYRPEHNSTRPASGGKVSLDDFDDSGDFTYPAGRGANGGGSSDDEKVLVCNGEFGKVLEVHPTKTIVEFSNPRRVVMIPRGKQEGDEDQKAKSGVDDENPSTGCDLALGYACTCHKLQGSSAPVIIVTIDEYPGASGSHGICDRAWLYTAISRAEKVCYLVGKASTMKGIVSRQYITRRKTFLVERIAELRADAAASGLADDVLELAESLP